MRLFVWAENSQAWTSRLSGAVARLEASLPKVQVSSLTRKAWATTVEAAALTERASVIKRGDVIDDMRRDIDGGWSVAAVPFWCTDQARSVTRAGKQGVLEIAAGTRRWMTGAFGVSGFRAS